MLPLLRAPSCWFSVDQPINSITKYCRSSFLSVTLIFGMHLRLLHVHQTTKVDHFVVPGTSLSLWGQSEWDKAKWIPQGEPQSEHRSCLDLLNSLLWIFYLHFLPSAGASLTIWKAKLMQHTTSVTLDATLQPNRYYAAFYSRSDISSSQIKLSQVQHGGDESGGVTVDTPHTHWKIHDILRIVLIYHNLFVLFA